MTFSLPDKQLGAVTFRRGAERTKESDIKVCHERTDPRLGFAISIIFGLAKLFCLLFSVCGSTWVRVLVIGLCENVPNPCLLCLPSLSFHRVHDCEQVAHALGILGALRPEVVQAANELVSTWEVPESLNTGDSFTKSPSERPRKFNMNIQNHTHKKTSFQY